MELIGEKMHIMDQCFLKALEERDAAAVCMMARSQVDGGATALDINMGRRKGLRTLTPWLLDVIREEIDLPLFLSSHVLGYPDLLKENRGALVVNAVTADPAELGSTMKRVKDAELGLVVLLVSPELTPSDVNGRLQLAGQVLETATEVGLPLEHIYVDPVIACRPDPATWSLSGGLPDMGAIHESIVLLKEMSEQWKTIVALSNASACLASDKRSALHCRLLPMLAGAGLDAVILNSRDADLMAVAKDYAAISVAA